MSIVYSVCLYWRVYVCTGESMSVLDRVLRLYWRECVCTGWSIFVLGLVYLLQAIVLLIVKYIRLHHPSQHAPVIHTNVIYKAILININTVSHTQFPVVI